MKTDISFLNDKLEDLLGQFRALETNNSSENNSNQHLTSKKKKTKEAQELRHRNQNKDDSSDKTLPKTPSNNENIQEDFKLIKKNSLVDFYPRQKEIAQDSLLDRFSDDVDLLETLKIQEFEGFYNLVFIFFLSAIIIYTFYIIKQHGIILSFDHFLCPTFNHSIIRAIIYLSITGILSFFPYILYVTAKGRKLRLRTLITLYVTFLFVIVLVPNAIVYFDSKVAPLIGAMICMMNIIFALKCHSFVATNYSIYYNKRHYVDITINHYVFYMFLAPTLVFEISYQMSKKVRFNYCLEKSVSLIVGFLASYMILTQFIIVHFEKMSDSLPEILLYITIPSFITWIIGFLAIFHGFLNLWSELIGFTNRNFYQDWWNTTTIGMFWRKWNIPVHEWCLRHVYIEGQIYMGLSKKMSAALVFLVSGVLHEIVCSCAFHQVSYFFLFGMISQIPMSFATEQFKGTRRGNFIMWLALFIGQPCLVVWYCSAFYTRFHGFWCY